MNSLRHSLRREGLKGHLLCALIVSLLLLGATACGSGTGGSQLLPGSATISLISVACSPSTVTTSATSQCSATVQGTGSYSSAVTWSASAGSINASGVLTAPGSAGMVTVTATSTEDTTKSGNATVTVQLQVPQSKHVVIVMEENQSYSTVVGNTGVWPNPTWPARQILNQWE